MTDSNDSGPRLTTDPPTEHIDSGWGEQGPDIPRAPALPKMDSTPNATANGKPVTNPSDLRRGSITKPGAPSPLSARSKRPASGVGQDRSSWLPTVRRSSVPPATGKKPSDASKHASPAVRGPDERTTSAARGKPAVEMAAEKPAVEVAAKKPAVEQAAEKPAVVAAQRPAVEQAPIVPVHASDPPQPAPAPEQKEESPTTADKPASSTDSKTASAPPAATSESAKNSATSNENRDAPSAVPMDSPSPTTSAVETPREEAAETTGAAIPDIGPATRAPNEKTEAATPVSAAIEPAPLVPSHVDPKAHARRGGRTGLWIGAVAAIVVLLGGGSVALRALSTHDQTPSENDEATPAAAQIAPPEAPRGAPSTPVPETATKHQESAPAKEPEVESSDEDVSVTTVSIRVHPDESRILEGTEVVGGSRLVVQLRPGQKRVFEIQHDGYSPRRLVVDGSQSEIRVGLIPSHGDTATDDSAPVESGSDPAAPAQPDDADPSAKAIRTPTPATAKAAAAAVTE